MKKILIILATTILSPIHGEEIISAPGLYFFGSNVVNSGDPNATLVRISASNVIIDLSGHIIQQDALTSDTTSVGIFIEPGITDVTIQNGLISTINGTGIVVSPGCADIVLKSLSINGCSYCGIDCRGTATAEVDSVSCINCSVEECGTLAPNIGVGVAATYTRAFFASDSYFSQSRSTNLAAGIYCAHCTSCDFSSCKFSNNRGGTGGIGAYIADSSDFRFENCTLLRNGCPSVSPNTVGCGIRIESSNNIMLVDTTIAASYAPTGSATNVSSINSSAIGLLDCIIIGATGGTYAAGIYAGNGSACAAMNCIVQGTTATGTAHGIAYSNVAAGYLRNNSILNTRGAPAVGIIDTTVPSASLIAENYAFNNGTNYVVTYSGSVTLPLIVGGFSGTAGLPEHVAGMLDNVSINYQATGAGTPATADSGSSLIVTLTATTSLITSPLAGIGLF